MESKTKNLKTLDIEICPKCVDRVYRSLTQSVPSTFDIADRGCYQHLKEKFLARVASYVTSEVIRKMETEGDKHVKH